MCYHHDISSLIILDYTRFDNEIKYASFTDHIENKRDTNFESEI